MKVSNNIAKDVFQLFLGFTLILFTGCNSTIPDKKLVQKNVSFWSLSTGSCIAYCCIPAADSSSAKPLIFVHGGPGAYQVSSVLEGRGKEWFRRLAKLGFDVYLYDQAGSGLSARLTDPGEYTVVRHIADLEAIRNKIGGKRLILIGSSWGAALAANYMAVYPDNVEKAIFDSPGKLDPSEWVESHGNKPNIPLEFLEWIINTKNETDVKRFSDLEMLMQHDLKEAYKLAPDSFVDPLMDEFTTSVLINTVYNKNRVKEMQMHGMGWWSYTMTNHDAVSLKSHPREKLSSNLTPVLIMRGDSDYMPWEVASQYEETFPNSKFVQIENAGHIIWLDKPKVYTKTIERFLLSK